MSNELIAKIRTGMRMTLVPLDWWREKPCGIRVTIDKEIDGSLRTRSGQLMKLV